MPEISRFYGLIVKMFFNDHNPPHVHVVYGEYNAIYDLSTLEMTEGDLPHTGQKLIEQWLAIHQNDLLSIWDTQQFRKLPPLP